MKDKTKKTPSRRRYEANNPVFSIRMPKNWFEEFNQVRARLKLSRKEFMAYALNKLKMDIERVESQAKTEGYNNGSAFGYDQGYRQPDINGYNRGFQEGYSKAKNEYYIKGKQDAQLCFYCAFCGEVILIEPHSDLHKQLIDFLRSNGWGHYECVHNYEEYG